jgi:hypothetical protein
MVGQPATRIGLQDVRGVAALPDGGFVFTADGLARVGADGRVALVLPSRSPARDGPLATATVGSASLVSALPDGGFAFVDGERVRRVTAEGQVTTIAGGGTQPVARERGQARDADLGFPDAMAGELDGSVLVVVGGSGRDVMVARITPDGEIRAIAGGGDREPVVGCLPAVELRLPRVLALGLSREGHGLAVVEPESGNWARSRVWRLQPDGQACLELRLGTAARAVGRRADGTSLPLDSITGLAGGRIAMAGGGVLAVIGRDGRIASLSGSEEPFELGTYVDGDADTGRRAGFLRGPVAEATDGGLLVAGRPGLRYVAPQGRARLAVALGRATDARTTDLRVAYRLTRRAALRVEVLRGDRVVARRQMNDGPRLGFVRLRTTARAGRVYVMRVTARVGSEIATDEYRFLPRGLLPPSIAKRLALVTADRVGAGEGTYYTVEHCRSLAPQRVRCTGDYIEEGVRPVVEHNAFDATYVLHSNGLVAESHGREQLPAWL